MSVLFLADVGLSQAIVTGERAPAVDVLVALEANLQGHDDPAALEFAANHGRIRISHDVSTPVQFSERLRSGGASPRLFLVPQRAPVGQILQVWSASALETGGIGFIICHRLPAAMFAGERRKHFWRCLAQGGAYKGF